MTASTNGRDGYRETARRIRDELRFHSDFECQEQLRDAWPLLWAALDDLVRLVEREDPREVSSPSLFDPD